MRLPVFLSRDEVARLIESAPSQFHRTILMTLYATGVRRTELVHLNITQRRTAPPRAPLCRGIERMARNGCAD
jgi:site-specific recombinase XerD